MLSFKFDSCLIAVLSLGLTAYSMPWAGTQPTVVPSGVDFQGTSPAPTQAPNLASHDLLKRQNQVCGYISGNINSPLTCAPGYDCAINSNNYAAGCCVNPHDCAYHTLCVPYANMGACGAACSLNVFNTICSNLNYPYCYVKLWYLEDYPHPFSEFDCANAPGTLAVYQTYTNAVIQPQALAVTPQYIYITTTPVITTEPAIQQVVTSTPPQSQPAPATPAAPSAGAGTIVNCGNGAAQGGSGNGITCVVGTNSKSAASRISSDLGSGGVLIRTCKLWAVVAVLSRMLF